MSATRVEPVYTNGTAASVVPDTVARSEAFYAKLLQLHHDVVAGKNPRLTFAQPPIVSSRNAESAIVPNAVAHHQTDFTPNLPGLNHASTSQPSVPLAVASANSKQPTSSNSTPAKLNPALLQKSDPKRIKEARQKLERAVAEYAKADEPILKNAREIPLNLLALAHARVAPVSGFKHDSSEDSFDEDSYYSSKADSWSTDHTEAQLGQTEHAIVISDGDDEDFYEPPSQVVGAISRVGQSKVPGIQHPENTNSNGEWEPDWDEDDEYEPPASTAFGGSDEARRQRNPMSMTAPQHSAYPQLHQGPQNMMSRTQPRGQNGFGQQVPTIAVNQIPAPVAPQPSRISPLTTGDLTHRMQSQISSIQQAQGSGIVTQNNRQGERQGNNQGLSAKETKKQKRQARKEAKAAAAAAESSKKRKRGTTPDRQANDKGKRRAVEYQQGSPLPYIKPEPTTPPPGLAAIPSRRASVVYQESPAQPSPYQPRSAYVSDQEQSPRGYTYANSDGADRHAMPPPKPIRQVERDSQDLRRVASSQHARRYLSGPTSSAPDYRAERDDRGYQDPRIAPGAVYRGSSAHPSMARRSPSPDHTASAFGSRYMLPPPRPGQIVEDAYGNRYIAELIPDDYPPPSRRVQADEYFGRTPSRRAELFEDDVYRMAPPSRSRAYSHMPEAPALDHRARAYSHAPQEMPEARASHRAYSVHPAAVPQRRDFIEADHSASYDRRPAPSHYQEPTSPRQPAYTSEYPPVQRAYSVRPDNVHRESIPEYSTARAGSMAPAGYARRGEMGPPTLPVTRRRDAGPGNDGLQYQIPNDGRAQYDERRVVSYRY